MKKLYLATCALMMIAISGCATIPPAAVELSESVTTGIEREHNNYRALLDSYVAARRDKIDQWVATVFLPQLVKNVRKLAGDKPIDDQGTTAILQSVVRKRDELQAELETATREIARSIDNDFALLARQNTEVTALLRSAVKVDQSRAALSDTVKTGTQGKIDIEGMLHDLDQKLTTLGSAER